ncbi:MAG: glycine zipper 2TM domain-containing protein [Betaproteobacteria bacterium]|nr:glycine zipper 2TM domain-containing protein [Betaproteobacteria bacterium]
MKKMLTLVAAVATIAAAPLGAAPKFADCGNEPERHDNGVRAGKSPKCAGYDHEKTDHNPGNRAGKAPKCVDCGQVAEVREVKVEGEGGALGAVAGGLAGGLLGNQVGKGTGKTVATVAGAGAGAYGGYQVEKKLKEKTAYQVSVRLDDGEVRQFGYTERPALQAGDRVRVENGALVRVGR